MKYITLSMLALIMASFTSFTSFADDEEVKKDDEETVEKSDDGNSLNLLESQVFFNHGKYLAKLQGALVTAGLQADEAAEIIKAMKQEKMDKKEAKLRKLMADMKMDESKIDSVVAKLRAMHEEKMKAKADGDVPETVVDVVPAS